MNYLYRMSHIDNIPHILQYGITHKSSPNANPQYISIGDSSIIDQRSLQSVSTIDGEIFHPGDFIPFYFYGRMPMLFNIQRGYKVKRVAAENIVYLIVSIDCIINDPNREYYFSDGHALFKMTHFYGKKHISQIDNLLDKDAITNNNWGEDSVVKGRKQAEFLVKGDIPTDAIVAMGCYNMAASNKLKSMGVRCPIHISKKAYY